MKFSNFLFFSPTKTKKKKLKRHSLKDIISALKKSSDKNFSYIGKQFFGLSKEFFKNVFENIKSKPTDKT